MTLETEEGPVSQEVSATLVIRGPLASVEISPQVATIARGEKVQFWAAAYDENHILLPDILSKWSMADPAAGSIDANGVFTAKGRPGEYPAAVQVTTVQRQRSSGQ